MSKGLRIAIVGGGITGLASAIALSKEAPDVQVDIYEATSNFSTVGAGIGMWPRIWEVMETLDLADAFMRHQVVTPGIDTYFKYRLSNRSPGVSAGDTPVGVMTYHRADVLKVLLDNVPSHYGRHFSKRLETYEDDPSLGAIDLRFTDGTSATCDVLLGTDGIKSAVRRTMYTQLAEKARCEAAPEEEVQKLLRHIEPTWSGEAVYRSIISREDLESKFADHPSLTGPTVYMAEHSLVITYPISQGQAFSAGGFRGFLGKARSTYEGPWVRDATQDELRAEFAGYEPAAQAILDLMANSSMWSINIVDSLPTYVSGRVALLGDAAHAMRPHQGSGAGQGIEDGLVLASLLGSELITPDTIAMALQAYDQVRRPFAQMVLDHSREMGELCYLERPWGNFREDLATISDYALSSQAHEIKQAFETSLKDLFGWAWYESALPQRQQAVEIFTDKAKQGLTG